ncbi:site-specific integrase [Mesonia sp. K4-1]|uniref:site-specific integrase n=1 Tax=Mesonia sp. K4-1 TaxID=2602760 RepID=UPI0011CAF738|nr:site-specific integrase [Mesonia sp. K4-1]TXK78915.1 tyrosine-type recombinase/integrase [Mesonia sp. K4-1]
MTVNYELRQTQTQRKKRSKKAQLFIRYCHQSKCTLFYTKKIIHIKDWDKRNQRVKRTYPGYLKMNRYLTKLKQRVEDIINDCLFDEIEPTVSYVKDVWLGRQKDDKKIEKLSFWQYVEKFIHKSENRLSPNTLRSYKTSFKNLKKFERNWGSIIDWHNINMDFYNNYYEYYVNTLGLKINGFGKIIKLLKTVLNEATQEGYNDNTAYKSKSFKVTKEEVSNIYLDEQELSKWIELDLNEDRKLEKVRDLFYVACYTGLRFSDLGKITKENINADLISIRTQKTGTDIIIPILNEVKLVLEKYNYNLPKPLQNQTMNRHLKKLGQLAEMDSDVKTYNRRGGKTITTKFKRWELISTHTARRSFATNMYKRGFDKTMIMKITGHSSEKVFMDYIKISNEENAKRFLEQSKQSA